MKKAIGSSLVIITINCIVGILSNVVMVQSLNYGFLATLGALSIAGILIGTRAMRFVPDKKLKPIFGWMILALSLVIFVRILVEY